MANYSYPPPFPPLYHPPQPQQQQQPPGTIIQEAYTNQSYVPSPQNPPQYQQPMSGIPGMELLTPVLDQNQLAYFWQQLASGNPALPSNVPLPQTSPVQPAPFSFPPYAPPPLPIPQQTQPATTQSSPVLDGNFQHNRVNELGRPDREEGELSEEGEVSMPDARTTGSWKNGRNSRKHDPKAKSTQGTPRPAPQSQQHANVRKENVSYQTPKSQSKQGKKNPPALRSRPATTTEPSVPQSQSKRPDLRQKAMEALNDLHAHGVNYPALAKETIFDAFDKDLLRQLFKDAGIPLEEPPPRQPPPKQGLPPPQTPQNPFSAQTNSPFEPKSLDPALVNLLSQGGMHLDPATLDKLAKAMRQNSLATSLPDQPTKEEVASPDRPMIPGLAPSLQTTQTIVKPSNETIQTPKADKLQAPAPAQKPKTVPAQKTTSSAGQPSAREAYLAKLAAAKNKKKVAGTPGPSSGESSKPTIQQPSQASTIVAPAVAAKLSTPAKKPVTQAPKSTSLPDAPTSTPSRSMVKMDVLQRKLDAERKAKQAQESAKANAPPAALPPSRSDSISSIEYNQSNSGSAQSGAAKGEAQEERTQSGSATPSNGAQAVIASNAVPSIPGLFLKGGDAASRQLPAASPRRAPTSMYGLPARPEPSHPYQAQPTHVLPPRPPPVASVSSPKLPAHAPRSQAWQQEASKKRPASAVSGPPSFAPAKRQHEYAWNKRYNRPAVEADESVVIDISSDEDDGDNMDIDDDFQTTTGASATKSLPTQKLLHNRALPPGLSGPSALSSPAAVSTPDPIGTAPTGNQQRLDELAEMKKRLQEQLKKKQEMKKSKLAPSDSQTTELISANSSLSSDSAVDATTSHDQPKSETANAHSSIHTSKNKPVSAATMPAFAPVLSPPQPSVRRSGLEAEISNDELLLQQMQKKMEEMQAKINRNKTELAQELEEIGIDTQGMSMETMEAVKEDIAQASLEDAVTGLPEPNVDKTLVSEPALPLEMDSHRTESASEDGEGEIVEAQGRSEAALPHLPRDDAIKPSDTTDTTPEVDASVKAAAVSQVITAERETPVLEAAVEVDDKMREPSDSSSENEDSDSSSEDEDDEDNNDEYEPETLVVPANGPDTINHDESDDDKMSTSSESSEASDSDSENADGVQLPIHEQAIEEEDSEDSDNSDEDEIYETRLEASAQSAVDVAKVETDAVPTGATPAHDQTSNEAVVEIMDDKSDSSDDGEISEDDNGADSALQLQLEAAMNEEQDDYEPEGVAVASPDPNFASTSHVDVNTSDPDSMAMQAEDMAVPEIKVSESVSTAPSAAAINGHGFVLPGLGSTVAYVPQPAIAPTDLDAVVTKAQVMRDDGEDDYEPSVAPVAPQADDVSSDDDADLYEPLPIDANVGASTEMSATTGAAEAGLSSDEGEPMAVDDGTLPSDEAGQHMRDMGLADNMILVQLGSLNPGRTDEDKKRWADGLRTLIGSLRAQGVKETDVVASQIASYRRNFFKDPSRIFDI
ncbi:hypothetical protein FKW77_002873 [Venturia effusa]|uniref:Uncharacterized protein n=1 Tax=Venturia effusa TaxID=50376 RepID=A0A517L0Z4_9PEZI|nr:hypothetical protein FKW77_002873 [Venturia effusa]